jgi:phosphatidate cytidylyltransferase
MTAEAERQGRVAPAGNTSDFVVRIASGLGLAVISLVAAILGGWATATVVAIVMGIVHLEWVKLTERVPWPSAIFTAALVIALTVITAGLVAPGFALVGGALLTAGITKFHWRPLGVLYAAALGVGLVSLRLSTHGLEAILLLFAVVWATDTGAFFAGRLIGGAKLWPIVSPNKTWAGALGGLAAGVVAGLGITPFIATPVSIPLVFIIVLLSIASQAGDLYESALKRWFGAKDTGSIVPGHGGLMDRVDSLTFAAGLAAIIGFGHGGWANIGQGLLIW